MDQYNIQTLKSYQLARDYSREAWEIYEHLNWQLKRAFGDQYLRSADSVGANIAEGYGRYHYLDKIRFYYNARGSLLESRHWLDLLFERNIITSERYHRIIIIYDNLAPTLNGLIRSNYNHKNTNSPNS